MTTPTPGPRLDVLEVLERALRGPAALTEPMPSIDRTLREDALRGLEALSQVQALVEAAKGVTSSGQIWSVNPHDLKVLREALQPFQGDTEK